jgi:hypothetical protein
MSVNTEIEDYLASAASLLGLPVQPEHRDEVLAAFLVLAEYGRMIAAFALPEGIEAAPRYTP